MNATTRQIGRRYTRALREYLRDGDESLLQQAYQMARDGLAQDFGVLDAAQAHGLALDEIFEDDADVRARLDKAGRFFADFLAPLELSHRGAIEGAQAMRHVNELLEAEQCRIAHALHDESGQLLASVHLALAHLATGLPLESKLRIGEMQAMLCRVESELRDLAHDLRPSILDTLGLGPALEAMVERVSARTGLSISIATHSSGRLPAAVETVLYRVVQEAINNAAKHAKARNVSIDFLQQRTIVACSIRDDGIGFPVDPPARHAGLGIAGLRERLRALGGTLDIASKPLCGSTLRAEIPIRPTYHGVQNTAG